VDSGFTEDKAFDLVEMVLDDSGFESDRLARAFSDNCYKDEDEDRFHITH